MLEKRVLKVNEMTDALIVMHINVNGIVVSMTSINPSFLRETQSTERCVKISRGYQIIRVFAELISIVVLIPSFCG